MSDLIPLRVSDQLMFTEWASELYVDEGLTGDGRCVRLDNTRSVSGLIRFDSALSRSAQKVLPKEGPHGS